MDSLVEPAMLLAAGRMFGVLATAPFFGNSAIPFRFRIGLCVVLVGSVVPLASAGTEPATNAAIPWSGLLEELLLGALFGLGVHIVFQSMLMAGQMLTISLGLTADQPGTQSAVSDNATLGHASDTATPLSRLLDIVALTLFVISGGPAVLLVAILDSLELHPLGSGLSLPPQEFLLDSIAHSTLLAVKIASPVLICQWLATLGVGIVCRSLGQASLFQLALPVVLVAVLCGALFALGNMASVHSDEVFQWTRRITDTVEGGTF